MEGAVVYPRRFAALVKLEHTVFALPFAYVGAFLALDVVTLVLQQLHEQVAAFILSFSGRHAVRDSEHSRFHPLLFSTK